MAKGALLKLRPSFLWAGVFLVVASVAARFVLNLCGIFEGNVASPMDYFPYFRGGAVVGAIVMVIVVPLVEEFAFRFWGRDTKVAYLADLLLITVFVFIGTSCWLSALVVFVALLLVFLLLKDSKRMAARWLLRFLPMPLPTFETTTGQTFTRSFI